MPDFSQAEKITNNLKQILIPWLFVEWKESYPPAAEVGAAFAAICANQIECESCLKISSLSSCMCVIEGGKDEKYLLADHQIHVHLH